MISDVLVGQLGMLTAVPGAESLVRRQVLTGDPLMVLDVPVLDRCVLCHVPVASVHALRRALLLHDHHLIPVCDYDATLQHCDGRRRRATG
jgi:hypothetical protein